MATASLSGRQPTTSKRTQLTWLGKDRAIWAVGHEQFDNIHGWSVQSDCSTRRPQFRTRRDGYEFYRRWLTTNHSQHWMEYGSTRPGRLFDGWNTAARATYGFIAQHRPDTRPVTLTAGGVCRMLGHAAFDILPQAGMYWWESQIEGTSQQSRAAYLRGAARQYGRKWLFDASPWSTVHGGPGWGYVNGKWSGGVTDETQPRSWIYGYLAGADAVLQESSGGTHFRIDPHPDGPPDKPIITSTGKTCPCRKPESIARLELRVTFPRLLRPSFLRPRTRCASRGPGTCAGRPGTAV